MPRPCPLCESPRGSAAFPYETRWSGRSFHYLRCEACRCTFVDPLPTVDEFTKMYSTEEYHDVHYGDASVERHEPSLRFLTEHFGRGAGRTLLDFGCGNGSFMTAARSFGFEVFGVEHSDETATKLAQRTGLDIVSLEARLSRGRVFDIIHMGDVLEHLPEPAPVLRSLERLLAPKGVFFVEGPLQANVSGVYLAAAAFGALRRRLRRFRPGTSSPTHLLLATARSQADFFTRRLGYRVAAFDVYEDGWPYLHRGQSVGGLGAITRRAIGRFAVGIADVPGLRGHVGNRFMTVVHPRSVR